MQRHLPLAARELADQREQRVLRGRRLDAGLLPLRRQRQGALVGHRDVDRAEVHRQTAELLDDRLGLAEVVAEVAGHVLLVEQAARRGERLLQRVLAAEQLVHDLLRVGRVVDRLTGELVVERGDRCVELQVVRRRRGLLDGIELLRCLGLDLRRGGVLVDLALTGDQRFVPGLVVGHDLEGQVLQQRVSRLPVARVALEHELLAEGVADHLEGPGPDRRGLEGVLALALQRREVGDPVGVGVDERVDDRRIRRVEVQLDRIVAGRRYRRRRQAWPHRLRAAGARRGQIARDVVCDVLRGERVAVGELQARAQIDGDGLAAVLERVAAGHVVDDLALRAELEEVAVDGVHQTLVRGPVGVGGRVEAGRPRTLVTGVQEVCQRAAAAGCGRDLRRRG